MTDVRDLARKYKMSLLLVEEADEENETQLVLLGNTEESYSANQREDAAFS